MNKPKKLILGTHKTGFKEGVFVKCKRNDKKRYVTKMNYEVFEDDGKISGEKPSPFCHYENYEPIELEVINKP